MGILRKVVMTKQLQNGEAYERNYTTTTLPSPTIINHDIETIKSCSVCDVMYTQTSDDVGLITRFLTHCGRRNEYGCQCKKQCGCAVNGNHSIFS